jgi:hypothetical protein
MTMKRDSLATYPRKADALAETPDRETVALSTNPEFLGLIQSSRERHAREGGLSSAEVRRRLAEEPQD